MSDYRDPTGADIPPDVPETEPVGPDDLPGSEDDDDGEEYVPLDPDTDDETDSSREGSESPGERREDSPPTPGAFSAPPPR